MSIESQKSEININNPEKEARIKKIEKRVDEVTDKLGMHIDEGIKDAVVGFQVSEIPTSQSCEGHLREGRGFSYPWVEVYAPEPKGWKESEEKQREWALENLKYRQKTMELLGEFYRDRETPFDARLTFANIGSFGAFRVKSMGAELMLLLDYQKQEEKLRIYREEMNAFAKFLKDKFLKQGHV